VGQILFIKVLVGQKSVQKRIGGPKRTFLGGNVYNYNNYFREKYCRAIQKVMVRASRWPPLT
jgi:hypothetical protein